MASNGSQNKISSSGSSNSTVAIGCEWLFASLLLLSNICFRATNDANEIQKKQFSSSRDYLSGCDRCHFEEKIEFRTENIAFIATIRSTADKRNFFLFPISSYFFPHVDGNFVPHFSLLRPSSSLSVALFESENIKNKFTLNEFKCEWNNLCIRNEMVNGKRMCASCRCAGPVCMRPRNAK